MDPRAAQQSSPFISTELTGVYIVPWLCVCYETDMEQWIQTCEMKGRGGRGTGGEIQSDFVTGWNKMSNLQGAAEQTGNYWACVQLNHVAVNTFWLLKHVTQSKFLVAIALRWLMWGIIRRCVHSLIGMVAEEAVQV